MKISGEFLTIWVNDTLISGKSIGIQENDNIRLIVNGSGKRQLPVNHQQNDDFR